ncbi:S-adenosylmethionine decarboxylase family protein [Actinoplanes sp. CA-131856]
MMRRQHQTTDADFAFGLELIMDIDGCSPDTIADAATLRRYVTELVDRIKMVAYGDTWIHHFGHATAVTSGYTAFQAIETSSIIIHVSEGLRRVHINVFSCRPFDPRDAMDYSETFFGGANTTYTILAR